MTVLYAGGYVDLPGTAGNYLSTPDEAALDITGDICIVARVSADDWTPGAFTTIANKGAAAGGTLGYGLFLWTTGGLLFQSSVDGTAVSNVFSTVVTGAVDGTVLWVAVTFDVDNGAAGRSVRFWTASDGVTWTQLGATVTTAGTTSIFTNAETLKIGSQTGTGAMFAGTVRHVSIRNGIGAGGTVGGTEVFRFDGEADLYGIDPAVSTFEASTGQTVTVFRSGTPSTAIVPPLYTATPAVETLSVHAFDLVTGAALGRLDVGQVQWSERLNARLELSCRLDLAHRPSAEMAPLLLPGKVKLVLHDPPVTKSFVLLETSYTERRFLNVRAAGLWAWFARLPLSQSFRFTQRDQHTIAARLVNWAREEAQGGGIGVAVDAPESGVLRDRTYNGFEYVSVGQRVDELAAVSGGFDFAIDTVFDGNVTVTEVWRPSYPRAGQAWPASTIQIDADGTAVALTADRRAPTTDVREVGAGEGTDMLTATAHDSTFAGYPPWWLVERRKGVERLSTLQGHADRDIELANRGVEPWTVTVLDRHNLLKGLTVGDECQIVVGPGDFLYPAGFEVVRRVVGRRVNVPDDGGPDRVTLELEESDV